MVQRIIFSTDGVKVSRPGYDAGTAANRYLSMHPGMEPMRPVYSNSATFSGVGSQDFTISNPENVIPFVFLKASTNKGPTRITYCAEMWAPYTTVRIRNIDGVARTVQFTVLF